MSKLVWAEDYGQYKKGDEFVVNGEGKHELLKSGAIKEVEEGIVPTEVLTVDEAGEVTKEPLSAPASTSTKSKSSK